VLRLLEDQPTNGGLAETTEYIVVTFSLDALVQLDASFQEVKDYYDSVMEFGVSRHGYRSMHNLSLALMDC
jgi:hypothetical protein